MRPVTHTADVAVKSASINEHSLLEKGSERRIVPIRIMNKKPSTSIWGGVSLFFIW